jgi:ariadne-1
MTNTSELIESSESSQITNNNEHNKHHRSRHRKHHHHHRKHQQKKVSDSSLPSLTKSSEETIIEIIKEEPKQPSPSTSLPQITPPTNPLVLPTINFDDVSEWTKAGPVNIQIGLRFLAGCLGISLTPPKPNGPSTSNIRIHRNSLNNRQESTSMKRNSINNNIFPDFNNNNNTNCEEDEENNEDVMINYEEEDNDGDEEVVLAHLTSHLTTTVTNTKSKSLSTEDIAREQEKVTREIAEVFNLESSMASAMLRKYKWRKDSLLNALLENQQKVFSEFGLALNNPQRKSFVPQQHTNHSATTAPSKHTDVSNSSLPDSCIICTDSLTEHQASSLNCKHWACNTCWTAYLSIKIQEGQVSHITCPATRCSCVVTHDLIKARVPEKLFEKFLAFVTKSYVDQNPEVKWCPAPGCGKALHADQCHRGVGFCTCGYRFCWQCSSEAHAPASCIEIENWRKKNSDDSETVHWIMTNTKQCPNPKCKTLVEKNGGCNHMICKNPGCKFEWCYVCQGEWKGHTSFYQCNRFESNQKAKQKKQSKSQKLKEQELEESRLALEKYLHYYQRYSNHELSRQFESQLREKTRRTMQEMRETDTSYQDVHFLIEATERLLECRKVLKGSYVKAYYMNDGTAKNLFEMLQGDLERATEKLAEILQQPTEKINRVETKNASDLCSLQISNMLDSDYDHLESINFSNNSSSTSSKSKKLII